MLFKDKVYLSSTFKDLKDYRIYVIQDMEATYRRSFKLSTIIEYMRDEGRQIPPLETCISQVKDSNIYILILGNCAGETAPGTNDTFTEIEFRTALENKKTIFAFVNTSFKESQYTDYERFKKITSQLKLIHLFTDMETFKGTFSQTMGFFSLESVNRKNNILLALVIGIALLLFSLRPMMEGIAIKMSLSTLLSGLLFIPILIFILRSNIFRYKN